MNWQPLHTTLTQAVDQETTPGGVVAIGHQREVVHKHPFGYLYPKGPEVGEETVFDIASLTKPFTALLAVQLADSGRLDIDAPVSKYRRVPGSLKGVLVNHLLGHAAGFPAHIPFFEQLLEEKPDDPRARLTELVEATDLTTPPGQQATYTDLGYMLLGAVLEDVTGMRLDEGIAKHVTAPMELANTRFVDLHETPVYKFPKNAVAPTEICPRRGRVMGQVHDENCHAAGGIAGHAGLFSNAQDLCRFAQELMAAWQDQSVLINGRTLRQFVKTSAAPLTTWRLGWDTPALSAGASHAGDLWPRNGFGHLGFTGCSLWLAPKTESWVVLLTNRVHPSRERSGIKALRRQAMEDICRSISAADPAFRV